MKRKNIKKSWIKTTVLSLFFSTSLPLFAQVHYGATAGYSINNMVTNQPHSGPSNGFSVGGFVGYEITDDFQGILNVEYLQLGARLVSFEDLTRYGLDIYTYPFTTFTRDSRINVNTINIPLELKYSFYEMGGVKMHAGISPELSFVLYAQSIDKISYFLPDGLFGTADEVNNITHNFNQFNFALSPILGITIPVSNYEVNLDFRYR
ncbi:MAG: outer membrane beta-barrel protein, partial [Bacteroidota bacterium]